MIGLFSAVKDNIPIGKKIGKATTEGPISLLHYRATTLIFFSCCILVTSLEWIGNGASITCAMVGPDDSWTIPKGVINSYCYIQSTFTVPGLVGDGMQAHPGVGPGKGGSTDEKHKAYYQWVSFLLFFQAMLFYFPHLVHKTWEGGKIASIISGLHRVVLEKEDRHAREKILAKYIRDNLTTHNMWGVRLVVTRYLYLLNVMLNLFIMDIFLDYEFSTYGLQVINLMEDDMPGRIDPMARIFPKVTKCTMRKYGPTGSIQNHDAICVLPINIINEKIYVMLWFWLLLLGALTLLSLLFNTLVFITPALRNFMLRSNGSQRSGTLQKLEDICRLLQFGDWMILYQLSRNMEGVVWAEFISELHIVLKAGNDNNDNSSTVPRRQRQYSQHSHHSHSSRVKTPQTSM